MKTGIFVSLFSIGFLQHTAGISQTDTSIPKSIHKRNVSVQAFYGFPNLLTSTIRNAYELTNQKKDQLTIDGFGPVGIRAEYFITDHIAMGAEISYANTIIKWQEQGTLHVNDSMVAVPYNYSFKLTAPRIRILGKFNFHFATTEHFDWYTGLGIGYNSTRVHLQTDAPYIRDYDVLSLYFLPLSARIDFGGTYYFTKHIGAGIEVGLGGPLISAGITAKF